MRPTDCEGFLRKWQCAAADCLSPLSRIAAGRTIYNVCLRDFRAANRAERREKLAADTAAPHKSTAKLGHALPEYALHGAARKLSLRLLPPNDDLLPPNDSMLRPNDGLPPPNEIEKRCEDEPRGIMPHEIST
ncbi:hypothetical protein [Alloprevotella tannerae]|uniref:hypothetical protein n=1 Tax=Alloprevotella tannerae TaxID=76122 RepID=UPI0028EAFFF3|nr:hypothetical protein [Alloprevotella tannerae]